MSAFACRHYARNAVTLTIKPTQLNVIMESIVEKKIHIVMEIIQSLFCINGEILHTVLEAGLHLF